MTHDIDGIDPAARPGSTGCQECMQTDSWWFHLRRCAQCGHIGCCDDSLNQHATKHFHQSGHPVIQSFEPGEDWFYDYRTDGEIDGPVLAAPQHHPLDQPTPGPAGRVPRNWQRVLTQAAAEREENR